MKDYLGYAGKTVVLTGASSGMGKAVAEMLVSLGANVYALSRRVPEVEGIKNFISTDLSSKESIDQAFLHEGVVFVTGSLYFLAQVRPYILEHQKNK